MPAIARYTKPIQVSLDSEAYEQLSIYASFRKTSLSAAVRELLARILEQQIGAAEHAATPPPRS